jgi:tetratricopeptide (TPR) repeat protein
VPGWIRKIVLRGLRPHADDRWPAMEDLLAALGKNPADARKKWVVAVGAPLVVLGMAVGIRQSLANREPPCSGGPAKLAGIWELNVPGEPESPRQAQIHRAFLASGKGYATDVYATVSDALSRYARSWAGMRKEACEATEIRKEQSAEVLDLRMECLDDRLGGLRALTDVFADATGDVVENAVNASNALGALDRCADVPLLRSIVRPPEDAATRVKVDALRTQLAHLKARFDAGKWRDGIDHMPPLLAEIRALGFQPLLAEALALHGFMLSKSRDKGVNEAEQVLVESFRVADASRHDEVRAEDATNLVFLVGVQLGRFKDAREWAETADSVMRRMGGHQLLQAWLLNDLGCVYEAEGDGQAAVPKLRDALSLKERVLGKTHPDVGVSEGNLGLALQALGRSDEALAHVERALAILSKGVGTGHPDVANELNNRGDILNGMGRFREARESYEQARVILERELDANDPNLGYTLTGIGISYLGEGKPTNALLPLEKALQIREAEETDPTKIAETQFALARALWSMNRDRPRARVLAERARAGYSDATGKVAEVERWIRDHAGGRSIGL